MSDSPTDRSQLYTRCLLVRFHSSILNSNREIQFVPMKFHWTDDISIYRVSMILKSLEVLLHETNINSSENHGIICPSIHEILLDIIKLHI